jgi:hypothetical protein
MSRRLVEHHAAIGTPHQTLAKLLQLSVNTLKKYYAEELELGLARANAVVGGTLFAEAKKGNITAAIFWMKTRGGWREAPQSHEVAFKPASEMTDAELEARIRELDMKLGRPLLELKAI